MGRNYMPSVQAGVRAFRYPDSAMPESLIIDSYLGASNPEWVVWPQMLGQELFFSAWVTGGISNAAQATYRRSFEGTVPCTLGAPSVFINGDWSYTLNFQRTNPFTSVPSLDIIGHAMFIQFAVPGAEPWRYFYEEDVFSPGSASSWDLDIAVQGSAPPCFYWSLPGPDGVVIRRPTWAERSTPMTWAESDPVDIST